MLKIKIKGLTVLAGGLVEVCCFGICFSKSDASEISPGVLPKYFSSEWSFAQFHLPEYTQFIAAFGSQSSLIVVGMDGRYKEQSFIIFSIHGYC